MLIELYREKFGEHIPLIRREDVRGFVRRKPLWLMRPLGLEAVRRQAEELEAEVQQLLPQGRGAGHATLGIRKLLGDLAEIEEGHVHRAEQLEREKLPQNRADREEEARARAASCCRSSSRAWPG